jgi:peptidyl-prolyl cis-trans isomerase C
MFKKVLIIAILTVFILGCDVLFPKKDKPGPDFSSAPPAVKGTLLAQVNDWAIGTGDFSDQLEALKTLYPNVDIGSKDAKKRILEELIDFEILAQYAETKGLDKDKDVMEAVKNFKRTFLAQKMLEEISRKVTITDVEVQNFYNSNRLNLREPEERKIREIIVRTESQAKDIVIKSLQGQSFSSLAKEYSIADSKRKNGDLGYLSVDPQERFQKFWEEAFTTEEGKISNYFQGPKGYYILKVEDKRGGKEKPLTELKSTIREYLRREKMDKEKSDIINAAREKFNVVINESLVN